MPLTLIDRVKIGKFCSIAPGVKILGAHHPTRCNVSTHPCFYRENWHGLVSYTPKTTFEEITFADEEKKYRVIVGNDVWIATDVKIINGVTIGDGAVVAAGAVVTKDVAPYSIVGGVPARVIRYRFDEEEIQFLLDLKWWDKGDEWIRAHIDLFDDIAEMKKAIEKENESEKT